MRNDERISDRCAAAYKIGRPAIVGAAESVDAWDSGSRGEIACAAVQGTAAAREMASAIEAGGAETPAALADGIALVAKFVSGWCVEDVDASKEGAQ